jgi:hypothetical protein
LKSARRYTNLSAAEVLAALREQKQDRAEDLPSERTMRDILIPAALVELPRAEWKKVRNFLTAPRSLVFLDRLHAA